jgi:hypothetical protein
MSRIFSCGNESTEEYCCAITQASRRVVAGCGCSGFTVLMLEFELDSFVLCTYVVDHVCTEFWNVSAALHQTVSALIIQLLVGGGGLYLLPSEKSYIFCLLSSIINWNFSK